MKQYKYTMLYAEDDEQTRDNYTELFQFYFSEVYTAKDGQEAYEIFFEKRPRIVILDINMPIMDGLTVAKKIKEIDSDVKIIMLTALSQKEQFLDAIKIQVTDYLIKPIKIEDLENTIFSVIDTMEKENQSIIELQDNYLWDKDKKILTKFDREIKLSKKEHTLISLLCSNKNSTFETEYILNNVWEDELDNEYDTKALRALISRIKSKLCVQIFDSVYNVGYKIKR